ncbi:MAG: decarboxylase [Desulfobacterales bacterium]|nr:decarboxylase [Desulfobacterales bacterium]
MNIAPKISLLQLFHHAIKLREKRLPSETLERYIESIQAKRPIFLESVQRFGSPLYFFDQPSLDLRIQKFREVFSSHFQKYRAFYAMKSNSFSGVCKQVIKSGLGLDVSSGFELAKALNLGCKSIIFSGPGKTNEELELVIRNYESITILIDSINEFQRLSALVKQTQNPVKISAGIRISSKSQKAWDKFGIPLPQALELIKETCVEEKINLEGIQFHTSWNLNPDAQVAMINKIGHSLKKRLPAKLRQRLKFIDIGGGFWPECGEWLNPENTHKGNIVRLLDPTYKFRSVYYFRKAVPLDLFAQKIANAISAQESPLASLEVWAEPGRWISHFAMHILLKVIDIKSGKKAITDGGTNLLGWERPLSEFIPIINLSKPSTRAMDFKVFGSLCTPLDIWGAKVFGESISPGDILLVPDQGAYTFSLRQSFIKPIADVIHYNGTTAAIVEKD